MALQPKRPTVYFSNQMEVLAHSLGQELWNPTASPFASKLIILPHHGLKSYLHRFFATDRDWNVAMGLDCKVLMDAIKFLLADRFSFPSQLALSFAIEEQLAKIEQSAVFSPVVEYLAKQKSPKALGWLIEELSKIFYEYGVFEPNILSTWKMKETWQQEIWKRVFSDCGHWKEFADVLQSHPQEEKEIHLFGFSHIPSHFYDFFSKFNAKWYFLSPSEMFWEDLCSDRERIYLEKKMEKGKVRLQIQEQLRFFLTKTHPLLANFGTTGKALLALFGKTECYIEERYTNIFPDTTLGFLQKSLLELDDEETKIEVLAEDRSLLCMSASSPLREVEILMQTLQELAVSPKEALILVSDMAIYEPYIHMVFGAEATVFPYCIHGLTAKPIAFEAIEHLEEMVKHRFDRDSVKKFISFPPIMHKWQFSQEEILWLEKQWDKAHIFFALNLEHKNHCLQKTSPKQLSQIESVLGGTWQEGIERTLYGLAQEEVLFSSPEWTQVELLGRAIELIRHLQQSCKPIYLEESHPLSFWIGWAEDWLTTHLQPSRGIEEFINYLQDLDGGIKNQTAPIPFNSFMRAVYGFFNRKKQSFQSHLVEAVKCMPLEMGGGHPAKVIYVLGCDAETLPGVSEPSSLEEVFEKKQTPSKSDQSRYLFLELILHAREHLIFSYTRVSPQDQKPQGPCAMIEEIFSYIDSRCFFNEEGIAPSHLYKRHHPTIAFSKEYFQKNALYPLPSLEIFSLAKSYYHIEKHPIAPFFPSWHLPVNRAVDEEGSMTVQVKDLEEFAKYPLRAYFKGTLDMYFDSPFTEDKEFFLSPLLQKKLLTALSKKEKIEHSLPLGRWKELAQKELKKELEKRKKSLDLLGVEESQMLSLEWVEGARKIEQREDRIILPALRIDLGTGLSITIKGHIAHVTPEGLIWFGKKKKEEYVHLWPTFLLFLCAAKELNWKRKCWLLQEEEFFPHVPDEPEKELASYLRLYLRALKEPCPIASSWALSFAQGEKESWYSKMRASSFLFSFVDPYKEWINLRDPPLIPSYVEKQWQEQWQQALSSLLQGGKSEDI